MKVTEAFQKGSPTLSFEFFPPKTPEQEKNLFEALTKLKVFKPDFVSVTYGAMGTSREKTFYWANEIKSHFGIVPVAHLTCVAATRQDISQQLEQLAAMGVENLLALRGDPPQGEETFVPPADGFRYAKELIAFIKKEKPNFCIGAAGFPEGRMEPPNPQKEIEYLKQKVEAGAEYIITQLFFDNRFFFDFTLRCRKAGIKIPILPGLMPITSLKQIKKITRTCGATIPKSLLEQLEAKDGDLAAVQKVGTEQAVKQSQELISAGIKGLHFFVMNQAEPISQILNNLKLFGRPCS